MSFVKALQLVRLLEGGKSDLPDDPGGSTNQGMTQLTFEGLGFKGSVLDASNADIAAAYRKLWDDLKVIDVTRGQPPRPVLDITPENADAVAFQFYINVSRVAFIRAFQGCIDAKMDGILGVQTWAALQKWNGRGADLTDRLLHVQKFHYLTGDSPYKEGLIRRVDRVEQWLAEQ